MRINPTQKSIRGNEVDPVLQAKIDKVTKIVALVIACLSTYSFFFKILFF